MEEHLNLFYKKSNIIGYTGDIDNNPTVYFLKTDSQGSHIFGHITQAHEVEDNVGRSNVFISDEYKLENRWVKLHENKYTFTEAKSLNSSYVNVETIGNDILHVSRHKFKVANTDIKLNKLAQAITKYPNLKKIAKTMNEKQLMSTETVDFKSIKPQLKPTKKETAQKNKAKFTSEQLKGFVNLAFSLGESQNDKNVKEKTSKVLDKKKQRKHGM
ncbi:hypothetical protein ACE939_06790 [Aquimarina sp. W85]|uniref:hypothetical protein n=1 Tax=Aquimarina rhodophyticola TaxID=3342246 RepID=UPI00366F7CD5